MSNLSQNTQNNAKLQKEQMCHPTGLPPESGPVGRFPQPRKKVLRVLKVL
jgi:hypothetical protein